MRGPAPCRAAGDHPLRPLPPVHVLRAVPVPGARDSLLLVPPPRRRADTEMSGRISGRRPCRPRAAQGARLSILRRRPPARRPGRRAVLVLPAAARRPGRCREGRTMTAPRVTWLPARSGILHAFPPGRVRSLCGLVHRARLPIRRSGRALLRHRCERCTHQLARPSASWAPPPPPRPPAATQPAGMRHGVRCACVHCRQWRAGEAAQYARDVEARIATVCCACVREWPGAEPIVRDATAAWAAALLAWELSGGTSADIADVHEAERALLDAWREATRRYEVLDGSHPRRAR